MAERYVTDRFMPDKAIDLIDEAASRVRMRRAVAPQNLKEAMKELETIQDEEGLCHSGPEVRAGRPASRSGANSCATVSAIWSTAGTTSKATSTLR